MDVPNPVPTRDLFDLFNSASAPLISYTRQAAAFDADDRMPVSAQRGAPDQAGMIPTLPVWSTAGVLLHFAGVV